MMRLWEALIIKGLRPIFHPGMREALGSGSCSLRGRAPVWFWRVEGRLAPYGHSTRATARAGIIAIEVGEPRGYGRARMAILADGSGTSRHAFVTEHVEPGTRIITDGWQGYRGINNLGYVHEPRSQRAARSRGEGPGELLPAVHRVASLAKR
jgi:hypothetical protein